MSSTRTGKRKPKSGRIEFDKLTSENVKQVFNDHATTTRSVMAEIDRKTVENLVRARTIVVSNGRQRPSR